MPHWQRLRQRLYAHDWVVYAKQPLGGPAAVLDYLGRYTDRVAISNERILGIDGNEVLLRVRANGHNGKKRTLRVAGTDLIDRFLQHACRAASSASAITACSPRPGSRPGWLPPARRSAHRYRHPR